MNKTDESSGAAIRYVAAFTLFLSFTVTAQATNPVEKWPWYGEWEQARFATFPPLVQSVLKRDEEEAIRLIENNAKLDEKVSEHEIRRMAEPRVKVAYVGGEPEADTPLVILAAVANLPRVVTAIGSRSPGLLSATDPKGDSALGWAARSGHAEVCKILLSYGLDPLHRDTDNYTPLSLAVGKKRPEVTRLLVAAIPSNRYTQVEVAEQVWIASYSSDSATLRVLLEAGVPPDYIAPQGNTALISAVGDVDLERVQLLLKYGAAVDGHLYRGRSIFEIAEANLSAASENARAIHRLILAAPHSESGWIKPANVERMEGLWKMIEGR